MRNQYVRKLRNFLQVPILVFAIPVLIDVFSKNTASKFIDAYLSGGVILIAYAAILALTLYAVASYIPDILRGDFHQKIPKFPLMVYKPLVLSIFGIVLGPVIAFAIFRDLVAHELPTALCLLLAFLPVPAMAISLSFWIGILSVLFSTARNLIRR